MHFNSALNLIVNQYDQNAKEPNIELKRQLNTKLKAN